jgi:hypothetical protein
VKREVQLSRRESSESQGEKVDEDEEELLELRNFAVDGDKKRTSACGRSCNNMYKSTSAPIFNTNQRFEKQTKWTTYGINVLRWPWQVDTKHTALPPSSFCCDGGDPCEILDAVRAFRASICSQSKDTINEFVLPLLLLLLDP